MALLVIVAAVAVYRLDPLDKWSAVSKKVSLPRTPHSTAQTMASRIKDEPECRKYRAEILAQDGKKGAAADDRIARAYQTARNDHCLNIDIE